MMEGTMGEQVRAVIPEGFDVELLVAAGSRPHSSKFKETVELGSRSRVKGR